MVHLFHFRNSQSLRIFFLIIFIINYLFVNRGRLQPYEEDNDACILIVNYIVVLSISKLRSITKINFFFVSSLMYRTNFTSSHMLKIEDNFNLSRRVAQSDALRVVNRYIAWSLLLC